MSSDNLDDFLTVRETARLLRISKDIAYQAVHAGTIPSIKIGKQFRIPRRALTLPGLRMVSGADEAESDREADGR